MASIPTQSYSPLQVTPLNLLDIISQMGMALKSNQTLNDWCRIFYSQGLHVFSGSDPENPPGRDKYPMVEIFPLADNGGLTIDHWETTIGLVCGIYDSELKLQPYQDFELQRGIVKLEELYGQILAVAGAVDLNGGYVAEISAHRDPDILFPFFIIGASIKIIKPL